MTKRGLSNNSHTPPKPRRWWDVAGLLAPAFLVPAIFVFIVIYGVAWANTMGAFS